MKKILILMFSLLQIFSYQTGKPYLNLAHSGAVLALGVNGDYLISGSRDKTVKIWNIKKHRLLNTIYLNNSRIYSIVTKKNKFFIAKGKDIEERDFKTGKLIRVLKGHKGIVKSLVIDKNHLISGSWDKTVKIWDIKTGKLLDTLFIKKHIAKLALKDNYLVIVTQEYSQHRLKNSSLSVLNLKNLKIKTIKIPIIDKIAIKNNKIFVEKYFGDIEVYDIYTLNKIRKYSSRPSEEFPFIIYKNYILQADRDRIKIIDIKTGKLIKRLIPKKDKYFFKNRITTMIIQGNLLITGSNDNSIRIWNLKMKKFVTTLGINLEAVSKIYINKDKLEVVTRNFVLKTFDKNTGKLIKLLNKNLDYKDELDMNNKYLVDDEGFELLSAGKITKNRHYFNRFYTHEGEFVSVKLNKNRLVASTHTNKIFIWDIDTKKLLHILNLKIGEDKRTKILTQGNYIVSQSYNNSKNFIIKIWDIKSGKLLKTFNNSSYIFSMDSNQKQLVLGDLDGNIIIVNLKNNKIKLIKGDQKFITALFVDGNELISAGYDNTLKIWDLSTFKQLKSFKIDSFVNSIKVKNNLIYVGCKDGSIKMIDKNKGLLVTIIGFDNKEWIAITKDGYFDSSKNGAKYLNVLVGNMDVANIEQFYDKFYRPNLVRLALHSQNIDTKLKLKNILPAPDVEIINTPQKTDKSQIQVTLKITPKSGKIGNIRLYLNGVAIQTDNVRSIKRKIKNIIYKNYNINLINGKNIIKAIVYNQDNTMSSLPAIHIIRANIKLHKPKLYALIIGIDKFRNPRLNLEYAVSDAKLFAQTLKKVTKGLFSKVNIELLTTKKTTSKDYIIKSLKKYKKLSSNDLFVFYVASHGTVDDGEYFLITSNVGPLSTRKLKQDALLQSQIKNLISNIPTTKKLIIFDTCDSGKIGNVLQIALQTRGLSQESAIKLLSRSVGSSVLSASASTQEALEGYNGHGLFTYVLSQGIEGKADYNKDGFIKTRELSMYVEDSVPEIAHKVFNRAQFPTIADNGEAFPIAKVK